MFVEYLVKGAIIGIAIAAPVGPIAILCMKRSLTQGRIFGFISGLGAASADAMFGLIAGSGKTFIMHLFLDYSNWIRVAGGLFLCYLGLKTIFPTQKPITRDTKTMSYFASYTSILLLTLANPLTILSFMSVFVGMGILNPELSSLLTLAGGIFIGSLLWWTMLTLGLHLFQIKLNELSLKWINRISGLIILAFGIMTLFR